MSVLYDITLEIAYRYDSPAASSRTLLRMLPLTGGGQQIVSGFVDTDPAPDFCHDGRDFFGNHTVEVGHDGRLSGLDFRFVGRVRRFGLEGGLDLSCPLGALGAEVAGIPSVAPQSPHHFVGPSERVRREPEIAAFAGAVTNPGMSALAAVEAVSHALHREFSFDPTATVVTTDPLETFHNRRGVCQDISHVTIAALRGIGIPAGYVSGFLRTHPPEGQPRLEGVDAMHAWVRAWCGREAGWIEIDPTNDLRVATDHVAVAVGRDYADVAPIKGSLRAAGSQQTSHRVDVAPVEGPHPR
jgi:transglutaminase-like putative cysteine protease